MEARKDIYWNGKIYCNIPTHQQDTWGRFKELFTRYPVTGNHDFKDGQDVSGLYELKRKGNMYNGQDILTTVYEASFKPENIITIPTPPQESPVGLDVEAKELVETFAETIPGIQFGVLLERDLDSAKQCAIIHCELMLESFNFCLKATIDEPLIENRINHYTTLKTKIESL